MSKTPLVDYLGKQIRCFVCEGHLYHEDYTFFSNPYGSLIVEVHNSSCYDALANEAEQWAEQKMRAGG